MVRHFSIPAKDPVRTGRVFAKVFDGELLNFPSVKGAVTVLARDGSGFAMEIWPENATQHPGQGGYDAKAAEGVPLWDKSRRPWDYQIRYDQEKTPGAFAMHVAISTKLSAEELIHLGQAEGWRCFLTDREHFKLVEMWVDNRFLFEIFPEGVELDRFLAVSRNVDMMTELWGKVEEVA